MLEVRLIADNENKSFLHQTYGITNTLVHKDNKKIFLGNIKDRTCRFCGKDSTQTTFKKRAHIIPEFMGNKYCFSNFECDNCNKYFGTLEDSLFNLNGILNSLSTVKGKKGYPKYRGKKEGLEIIATDSSSVKVKTDGIENDKYFSIDTDNNEVRFDTTQPSYIPQDAFKALVKIGICMLGDNEISDYVKAIDWILKPNTQNYEWNPFFTIFRKIGGKKRFLEPWAILMRKRNDSELSNFPFHTLILFYGIFQYQIFLPFHTDNEKLLNEKELIFPLEEHLISDKIINGVKSGISVETICVGGNERLRNLRQNFRFNLKE